MNSDTPIFSAKDFVTLCPYLDVFHAYTFAALALTLSPTSSDGRRLFVDTTYGPLRFFSFFVLIPFCEITFPWSEE